MTSTNNMMSWNCNGRINKTEKLTNYIKQHNYILKYGKTRLSPNHSIKVPNFQI